MAYKYEPMKKFDISNFINLISLTTVYIKNITKRHTLGPLYIQRYSFHADCTPLIKEASNQTLD